MIVPTKLSGVFTKAKFVELHCALTLALDPVLFGTPEQLKFQRKYAFDTWNRSTDERRINMFAAMVDELVKADPKNAFFTNRRFIQLAVAFAADLTSKEVTRRARRNFGLICKHSNTATAYNFFLVQYGRKILGKITKLEALDNIGKLVY